MNVLLYGAKPWQLGGGQGDELGHERL